MQQPPKLIFLNGPPGIGKTTLAKKYLQDHPLALHINGDENIANIGQWLAHEAAARRLSIELAKSMARTHLQAGYDVILPFLLAEVRYAADFEAIAKEQGALFVEVVLTAPKAEMVQRIFKRGTWGEPGSPPLIPADRPIIEELYNKAMRSADSRPAMIRIASVEGDIDGAYRQLLAVTEIR